MSSGTHSFYAHGKFLLTAEYLVLHGAGALVLPLKRGQHLRISPTDQPGTLHWTARYGTETFADVLYGTHNFAIRSTTTPAVANNLARYLHAVRALQPGFLRGQGARAHAELEFPLHWGLGSSSTLTANLAQWAGTGPFQLHWRVAKGSGYDIAAATAPGPLRYRLRGPQQPDFAPIHFAPPFRDKLFFVYQGQKQHSDVQVKNYLKKPKPSPALLQRTSEISEALVATTDFHTFRRLLAEHETLLGRHLGLPPVQQARFRDFPGTLKSLGAWGGDFMLAACDCPMHQLKTYFARHGLHTLIPWDDIVL